MLEQIANPVKFIVFYSANRQGMGGLTVTTDVYDPLGGKIISDAPAIEIGGGLYSYLLEGSWVMNIGEYVAIFKTDDMTVDQQHIPALWVIGRAGIENLNAPVSEVIAKVSTLQIAGNGERTFTYCVTLPNGMTPIEGVSIWITDDLAGKNILAMDRTNREGKATFHLNPGVIYIWRQKYGYNFSNPDKEVIV